MEAAIASGIMKIAGDKLGSLLASEFAAITGVRKNLLQLHDIHREIGSWLTTVRDLSIENDPRFSWVTKLKDVAYDIDDLLYEVYLEAEKHNRTNSSGKHATTDILSAKPKSLMYRLKVAQKVNAIQEKLTAIAKQRSEMNAIGLSIPLDMPIVNRYRANAELSMLTNVEESQIPTRDQEKVSIIGRLLETNDAEHGWIISIVGLGGTGKTTLAKHICHDNKIKEQFKDKIYWVYVSQDFDLKNLIGKMFEAITKQKSDLHALQHMLNEISKKLTSEKYLFVLDDAWHQDKEDWNRFKVQLKGHAPGSKLLLTTRDQKVAEVVKSEYIFNLAYLSKDESWSLFLKNSEWKEEDLGSEFIQVGKEIVKKCGGVPLAIKTLGGILNEKREISTWRAISQSDLWIQENIEDRVFASLKLSYIHLKDHLKECFIFCSIFPKGYGINKKYLIEQWIANGFIEQKMRDEQPEAIGSEYFGLLVKVGFLEEIRESWYDSEVEYKMHDLIHDLTRYILHSEVVKAPPNNMGDGFKQNCRYLSLKSGTEKVERSPFRKVRALCALEASPSLDKLVKKNSYICSVVLKFAGRTPFPVFILKMDYLRYLEIYNVFCTKLPDGISGCWNLLSLHFIECRGFGALPSSIGQLKKLRNLDLTKTDLESLPHSVGECQDLQSLQIQKCDEFKDIPNSIGKNQNLRVLEVVGCPKLEQLPIEVTLNTRLECLNLQCCYKLVELPRGIGNLKRLEVLNLRGCYNLIRMPSGIAQLTALKMLNYYIVGEDADDARISCLENLNMIIGELELKNLPHMLDSSVGVKTYLKKKENLKTLYLEWSMHVIEEELVSNTGVIDALEPPSHIERLEIVGYQGSHLPCWMSVQSQSRFLCLNTLVLHRMTNLKHMPGILVFLSLKHLILTDLPNLEEMWTTTSGFGIGDEEFDGQHCFPILGMLTIYWCPKLIVKPYLPPSVEIVDLKCCKNQLVCQGSSSIPLLASTSDHFHVDGSSICNGTFTAAPHLKGLILSQMITSVSYQRFLHEDLPRLETLSVSTCEGLTKLPERMRGFTSLKELRIRACSNLMALPECLGELRSLRTIEIRECPMMVNLPRSIGYLTSLMRLEIWECHNLKQLPDEIEHLTSLVCLWLNGCKALTELPKGLGKLSTLERLRIDSCPALRSLPSSIQHLTSLQHFGIWGCPELSRRCKKEVGDDWHLISHVPDVDVHIE